MNASALPMTVKEEFEAKLNLRNAFRDTAKSCIQLSTAALALPILFMQAMVGKNENGLRYAGSWALRLSWAWFLLAILFGLVYQWASIRRSWDELHSFQFTPEKASQPGFRTRWYVVHFPKLNLSIFYFGMFFFFLLGALFFVIFAAQVIGYPELLGSA
jgi:hypothetical protein